jgi:HAD superfamily hydrolase (TIGR01484 family)
MTDRLSSRCEDPPWLVALDIDGTLLHEDGSISDAVIEQVRRLDEAGHQVMLATGRSSAATIPVLEHLGITPRFLVCSNGAICTAGPTTCMGSPRRTRRAPNAS